MTQTMTRVLTAVGMIVLAVPAYWYLPLWGVQAMFVVLAYLLVYEGAVMIALPQPAIWSCVLVGLCYPSYLFPGVMAGIVYCLWLFRVVWMFISPRSANPYVLFACQQLDIALFTAASLLMYEVDKSLWLSVVAVVVGIDTFGYFGGRVFGRIKAFPLISPNKTLEGYMSALVWSFLVLSIILILRDIPILNLTLSMIMVYILATTGDLLVSYQKRILNVKDSSSLLPGHGGFLDRFDSWMLVIPFVYLIFK